jgi:hypothetical protein
MALTTFVARQFYNIPSEYGTFTAPTGVFVVTGSVSRLLINNTRTNLASDSMSITTQNSSPYVANSGTSQGWWPAGTTAVFDNGSGGSQVTTGGIIVGGADGYANTTPDGRLSTVSVWGWQEGELQATNDALFIELAGYILGTTYANTGSAKSALRSAGFYYQYPVGFDGQSPNTGDGSDTV